MGRMTTRLCMAVKIILSSLIVLDGVAFFDTMIVLANTHQR